MLWILGILFIVAEIKCDTDFPFYVSNKSHPIQNGTSTDKLKKDLFLNYDRFARPAHHNKATDVNFSLSFNYIDINEQKSIVTLDVWSRIYWMDDKLKWNPANYDGLEKLHVPEHEVWKPDIVLYNSALGNDILHYGKTLCIVYPTGQVLWVPPTQFQVFCDLDLKKWPYDEQKCMAKVGSWTYSANMLNLKAGKSDFEPLIENPEWQIIDVKTTRHSKLYECCSEPYVDIEFNITLRRRSEMQKVIAFTPITIVTLTTLASFWLPSESGEKIVLNGINAVILIFCLKYFSTLFPISSTHVPFVVCQYCVTLFLVSIALVLNVIVINLSRNPNKTANVPGFCKSITNSWYGQFLGLGHSHPGQKSDGAQPSSGENHFYWSALGTLIDRTAFLVYFITIALMTLGNLL